VFEGELNSSYDYVVAEWAHSGGDWRKKYSSLKEN
jgi:hypothetical protein